MAPRPRASRQVFGPRDFSLPGVIMFGRYQHATSQSGLLPHSHRHAIEICFLERGEQTYRVGALPYRLRGNDQFFTLPGEVHDTAHLPQERGILYWVILRLSGTGEFLGLGKAASARLRRELLAMPTRHFRSHPECGHLLGEITKLLSERHGSTAAGRAYRKIQVQALLLHYLTRTIGASRQGLTGRASPLIERLVRYVDAHLSDPIQVPRLAQVAKLSESRCKIRFKREIGVPPAEFWLRKKIERAIELLKTRSVTDVAYDLGFSSSQYFATVFKRYTLLNPSQFHRPKQSELPARR